MTGALAASPYRGDRFALLTQHGKERVISPLFAETLGATVERATGFDTDTLGTFTRDIAREGSQLEAARTKARKGMQLARLPLGVASEGAFGPAPLGLFAWNVELVVLIDQARGLEIVGRAEGPALHLHERVSRRDELEVFARRASFPSHGLVVRPDGPDDPRVTKGLADWSELHASFDAALTQAKTGAVHVESDLRAHMNPTRMAMIRRATEDLLDRMTSLCPSCGAPGFWRVERMAGLPCRECDGPTDETRAERWACAMGDHFEIRDLSAGRRGDPYRCGTCNP